MTKVKENLYRGYFRKQTMPAMRKLGGEGVQFAINTSVLTKKTVALG